MCYQSFLIAKKYAGSLIPAATFDDIRLAVIKSVEQKSIVRFEAIVPGGLQSQPIAFAIKNGMQTFIDDDSCPSLPLGDSPPPPTSNIDNITTPLRLIETRRDDARTPSTGPIEDAAPPSLTTCIDDGKTPPTSVYSAEVAPPPNRISLPSYSLRTQLPPKRTSVFDSQGQAKILITKMLTVVLTQFRTQLSR